MHANSYNEITEPIEVAIEIAAKQLDASQDDVRAYFLAGGDWGASNSEELAELICECWTEQSVSR